MDIVSVHGDEDSLSDRVSSCFNQNREGILLLWTALIAVATASFTISMELPKWIINNELQFKFPLTRLIDCVIVISPLRSSDILKGKGQC